MILGSGVAWRVVGFVVCSFFFLVRFVSFSLSISFIHKYISFFHCCMTMVCPIRVRVSVRLLCVDWSVILKPNGREWKKNLYILIIRIGIVQKFSSKLKHTLNNTIQDICRLLFFYFKSTVYLMVYFCLYYSF